MRIIAGEMLTLSTPLSSLDRLLQILKLNFDLPPLIPMATAQTESHGHSHTEQKISAISENQLLTGLLTNTLTSGLWGAFPAERLQVMRSIPEPDQRKLTASFSEMILLEILERQIVAAELDERWMLKPGNI